jgi:DNA-binding winged helix-turn-helix (wHTH) protein
MTNRIKQFYRFGPFRADSEDRLLLRDGEVVTLTPKCFDLLLFLIENRGRVLDKQALMTGVWPGVSVEESNLTKNIFLLRKSLGERPDGKSYIETFPRRGYRFEAEVVDSAEEAADPDLLKVSPSEPVMARTSSVPWYFWVCCAAGIILVAASGALWRRTGVPEIHSLAVLPFRTVGAPADAYLAEGLADELTTRLARIKSLRVISSQVAERFRDSPNPRDLGQRLGVDGVLTGTIRKEDQHVGSTSRCAICREPIDAWPKPLPQPCASNLLPRSAPRWDVGARTALTPTKPFCGGRRTIMPL